MEDTQEGWTTSKPNQTIQPISYPYIEKLSRRAGIYEHARRKGSEREGKGQHNIQTNTNNTNGRQRVKAARPDDQFQPSTRRVLEHTRCPRDEGKKARGIDGRRRTPKRMKKSAPSDDLPLTVFSTPLPPLPPFTPSPDRVRSGTKTRNHRQARKRMRGAPCRRRRARPIRAAEQVASVVSVVEDVVLVFKLVVLLVLARCWDA